MLRRRHAVGNIDLLNVQFSELLRCVANKQTMAWLAATLIPEDKQPASSRALIAFSMVPPLSGSQLAAAHTLLQLEMQFTIWKAV